MVAKTTKLAVMTIIILQEKKDFILAKNIDVESSKKIAKNDF